MDSADEGSGADSSDSGDGSEAIVAASGRGKRAKARTRARASDAEEAAKKRKGQGKGKAKGKAKGARVKKLSKAQLRKKAEFEKEQAAYVLSKRTTVRACCDLQACVRVYGVYVCAVCLYVRVCWYACMAMYRVSCGWVLHRQQLGSSVRKLRLSSPVASLARVRPSVYTYVRVCFRTVGKAVGC